MKRATRLLAGLVVTVSLVSAAPAGAQTPTSPSVATPPPAASTPAAAPPAAAPATATPPATGVAAAPAVPTAPAATTEPVWLGAVEATPTPAAAQPFESTALCVPSCRSGYTCAYGRCVSACNPPCRGRLTCSEHNECVRPPTPIKPGAHRHDGFLVRASQGTSVSALRVDARSGRALADTSLAWNLTVDVGLAPIDNLIVRGRVSGALEAFKDSPLASGESLFGFATIGAGADYYFMPINLYVGATLALAGMSVTQVRTSHADPETRHSRPGFGIDLDVAKEWWLTGNWGLGVGARLRYLDVAPAHMVPNSDGRLSAWQVGVVFSATYN